MMNPRDALRRRRGRRCCCNEIEEQVRLSSEVMRKALDDPGQQGPGWHEVRIRRESEMYVFSEVRRWIILHRARDGHPSVCPPETRRSPAPPN